MPQFSQVSLFYNVTALRQSCFNVTADSSIVVPSLTTHILDVALHVGLPAGNVSDTVETE